uniref:Replication protein E1 n=1 Tax=Canis familiaris papillomavirus 2 TaxID=292792 RepID=A0A451FCV5_9PAPI|nr:E1 protein [Canis familiaris papillomavirus 2]
MAEGGERGNETEVDGEALDAGWFVVHEADCAESDEEFEKLFDKSTCSNVSDLIDDDEPSGVNEGHAGVLNQQLLEESEQQTAYLKRKYCTPSPKSASVNDLSPRLQAVSLSPRQKHSKRRLFEDSGIENSFDNEVEDSSGSRSQVQNGYRDADITVLQGSNQEATILAKFKGCFGVSLKELTRPYKSSKTCCNEWVVFAFGIREELLTASKTLLQPHCDFFLADIETGGLGYVCLYLITFKAAKNRETITKLFCSMLNCYDYQLRADPPKNRSVAVALFFYKLGLSGGCFKHGDFPPWLAKQLLVSHQQDMDVFELSKMVQWAYDNDHTDESEIAFHYACLADEDSNAAAWLKSNAQAKYVADCSKMVRHYKKQEMRNMSMSQWIYRCCYLVEGDDGDWTVVAKYLKYQGVSFLGFLTALRHLFEGTPKKQCLLIYGPPDTGKSWFCFSLLNFLRGKVVSYQNSRSHFWLSPLADCKVGMLDDATHACFQFIDVNMRSAFDGNYVSVDCKHKAPIQIKLPPMLVTSNVNLPGEACFQYLHSRVTGFEFPRKFPIDQDGSPVFSLTHSVWKAFFKRLHHQLGLDPEDENAGESCQAFRCTARSDAPSL